MTKPEDTPAAAGTDKPEQSVEQIFENYKPVGRLMIEGDEDGFIEFSGDAAEAQTDGK